MTAHAAEARQDRRLPTSLSDLGWSSAEMPTPAGRPTVYETGPREGSKVLLLHGIGGGGAAYLWKLLGPILAGHRLIAPSFVG